jgi:hypothetical protein
MNIVPPLEPMKLNCWKHHFRFIQQEIISAVNQGADAVMKLPKQLECLGDSYLDLYTGPMKPTEIAHELLAQLGDLEVATPQYFGSWVEMEQSEYRILHLSDLSFWRVQAHNSSDFFIEFAPGRNAYHTLRLKADALRTAIMSTALSQLESREISLDLINAVRVHHFGLEPKKMLMPGCDLNRILSLMNRKPVRVTVVA